MRCQEMEEILSAYANHELKPDQQEQVERHLAGCARCREKLAEYHLVRQQMETLKEVPSAPDIEEAVMSKIKSFNPPEKPFKIWGKRALVLVPVAVILAALLIIQPWSSLNDTRNTLDKVHAAMAGIQSYRISMMGITNEGGQTTKAEVTAEYVAPDRYHYRQTGDDMNFEFIVIGDKQYTKGDYISALGIVSMSRSYSGFLNKETTLIYIDMLTDIQELPEETIEGVRCLRYRGVYDFEKMLRSQQKQRAGMGLPPLSEEQIAEQVQDARSNTGSMTVELWIGKADYLVRQMRMDSQRPGSNGELTSSSVTLKFFDFNQPLSIEAPLDSSGQLLPGWTSPTPEQPAFSKDVQVFVNDSDLPNRRVKYVVSLTNISADIVKGVNIRAIQSSGNGVWGSKTGPSSPGPHRLEPGASLQYEITFGYDVTSVQPEKVVESIQNSSIYIEYLSPDSQQKVEMVHFSEIPDSVRTLPADLPSLRNLTPAGEFKVEEAGATSAGHCVGGEIGGKQYLFVLVGTQNSDEYLPPGILVLINENPAQPVKAAYLPAPENTVYMGNLTLSGTVLYVSADNFLWIIDVSHPEKPEELARFTEIKPGAVSISGKYAFIQTYREYGYQGLSAVDISDPSHPQMIGSLPLDSRSGMRLGISGDYLLVWAGSTLYTIDISSPEFLKIVNSYTFSLPLKNTDISPAPRISPAHVLGQGIKNGYAYTALGMNEGTGISIMDISDPTKPFEIASLDLKDRRIQGPLFVSHDRVYVLTSLDYGPDRRTRIAAIDISDPTNPVDLGYGFLPDFWSFFPQVGNSSVQSYGMIDQYFYWCIGYRPNQPVIEIFDLDVLG